MRYAASMATVLVALWAGPAAADWTDAACEIYPAGSDRLDRLVPCTFAQNQGHITITLDADETRELEPAGDAPGNFVDQNGRPVYRQSGLGDRGLIFRFPDVSVFVYWTRGLQQPTAPFTTEEYDATTLLPCRDPADAEFGQCPAGILRMENGQASIVVQNQRGERFSMNFMKDATDGAPYVNATNREVEARFEGDTWIVTIDGGETYEVPLAAIEGG